MRVLLVEDNPRVSKFIVTALSEHGFTVDTAEDGIDGLHLAQTEPYDLVVLDLGLPKMDGLHVLERLRASRPDTPVLVLTARDSVEDRVRGLDAGADDYIVKPFAVAEVLARVRALMRRRERPLQSMLVVGDVSLDPARREVRRRDERIDLTAREFAILAYFLGNPGTVLSRTMILEHVWDFQANHMSNVIDVHVRKIRIKLGDPAGETTIRTVRGVGYVYGSDPCN